VTYSGSYRTVKTFKKGNTPFDDGPQQAGAIVTPNLNGANVKLTDMRAYDEKGRPVGGSVFPAYVTVSAKVDAAGVRSFDVGAASGGPDRTMGGAPDDIRGRDDIKTWAD
jgi:hypothetical protein